MTIKIEHKKTKKIELLDKIYNVRLHNNIYFFTDTLSILSEYKKNDIEIIYIGWC